MSRILEFQHSDEHTIVARVLLELHQALDQNFPQSAGSSRQFSKTVLAPHSENTAVDQQPGAAASQALPQTPKGPAPSPASNSHAAISNASQNLEFSKPGSLVQGLTATVMQEAPWSRWLTRILLVTLFAGAVLLAWIYLFGPPT